jgi:hypothetical protein
MAAPTAECPAEFISLAERLADATGRIVRHHFRSPLEIITKADDSPVTIADREAEKELRRMVALAYPQHGLIGEEFPAERRDADYVWVFDPIDGTKSFITGRPLFGTLIALLHRGRPILGIIDHPALGERWIGAADCVRAAPTPRPKAPSSQNRAAANTEQISEGQVQALMDGMDAATARHDVNAILGYLASDAVWELEYRLPQGLQLQRLNKDEYAARLREGAPLYRSDRENTRILIAPGARYAEVTATLRETIKIKGEPLSGVTRSKSMVEMRDGRPLITLVRATTIFDVPEGMDSLAKQKGRGLDAQR